MSSVCLKLIKISFLLATFAFAVTGCGSSSSTAGNETGSIAAKLVWSAPEAKTTGKTLYAAPLGVTNIKVFVYSDVSMTNLIKSKDFTATPGVVGSGTIDGIPAGDGRAIKVEGSGFHAGLGVSGVLLYLGTKTVNVVAGPTPTPVTIEMKAPETSATPASGTFNAGFEVTLNTSVPATLYYTTNEPATIYYTTNGSNPTTNSPNPGTNSVKKIWIDPDWVAVGEKVKLKYFAVVKGLYESITTQEYVRTN